jgi:hypothetical protein
VVAVKIALPLVVTALTEAVRVPKLTPAGILMEDGTETFTLSEARVTGTPFAGALSLSVTMQVDVVPLVTVAGLQLREERSTGGVTVTVRVICTDPL